MDIKEVWSERYYAALDDGMTPEQAEAAAERAAVEHVDGLIDAAEARNDAAAGR